jgi:hypothetical protein
LCIRVESQFFDFARVFDCHPRRFPLRLWCDGGERGTRVVRRVSSKREHTCRTNTGEHRLHNHSFVEFPLNIVFLRTGISTRRSRAGIRRDRPISTMASLRGGRLLTRRSSERVTFLLFVGDLLCGFSRAHRQLLGLLAEFLNRSFEMLAVVGELPFCAFVAEEFDFAVCKFRADGVVEGRFCGSKKFGLGDKSNRDTFDTLGVTEIGR